MKIVKMAAQVNIVLVYRDRASIEKPIIQNFQNAKFTGQHIYRHTDIERQRRII